MRHEVLSLNMATANTTAGAARDIRHLANACVYIHQETSGDAFSVKVQGKISDATDVNDDWIDIDAGPITGPKVVPLASSGGAPLPLTHVRIYVTTYNSGTKPVKACVAGYNVRTS